MKILLLITITLITTTSFAHNKKSTPEPRTLDLTGQRWHIKSQAFASHDQSGTDIDTVSGNEGDYITFNENGYAYCLFNGIKDTLEYKLIGKDSLSFGDTPFIITSTSPDHVQLYQNEEEKSGAYNRVTYTLISEEKYAMKTMSKK